MLQQHLALTSIMVGPPYLQVSSGIVTTVKNIRRKNFRKVPKKQAQLLL